MSSYEAVHHLLRTKRGPARDYRCCGCGLGARHWAYDHEDPNEVVDEKGRRFSRNIANYFPLCGRCHFRFDAPWSNDPRRSPESMASADYPSRTQVAFARAIGTWPPPPRPAWPPE